MREKIEELDRFLDQILGEQMMFRAYIAGLEEGRANWLDLSDLTESDIEDAWELFQGWLKEQNEEEGE